MVVWDMSKKEHMVFPGTAYVTQKMVDRYGENLLKSINSFDGDGSSIDLCIVDEEFYQEEMCHNDDLVEDSIEKDMTKNIKTLDNYIEKEKSLSFGKGFTKGGIVTSPENNFKLPIFDRSWWLCEKCGKTFEDYTNPPTIHKCRSEDIKQHKESDDGNILERINNSKMPGNTKCGVEDE